jgi:hypothetical protein
MLIGVEISGDITVFQKEAEKNKRYDSRNTVHMKC